MADWLHSPLVPLASDKWFHSQAQVKWSLMLDAINLIPIFSGLAYSLRQCSSSTSILVVFMMNHEWLVAWWLAGWCSLLTLELHSQNVRLILFVFASFPH